MNIKIRLVFIKSGELNCCKAFLIKGIIWVLKVKSLYTSWKHIGRVEEWLLWFLTSALGTSVVNFTPRPLYILIKELFHVLLPILSRTNSVHAFPSYFFNIRFNIILQSTPRFSKWSLFPQVFSPKPCMHLSCHPYALHALLISFSLLWSPE